MARRNVCVVLIFFFKVVAQAARRPERVHGLMMSVRTELMDSSDVESLTAKRPLQQVGSSALSARMTMML